jgi:uncharacterized surface protein with fasciclin (FAS1) repeats
MHHRQLIVCLFFILCLSATTAAQELNPSIGEIVATDERFTVLRDMLNMADPAINDYLTNPAAELTFFAPTNAAMETVFGETKAEQQVYADTYPYRVNEILRSHIVPMGIEFENIRFAYCNMLGTAQINAPIVVYMDDGAVTLAHEQLPDSAIAASNGLVYPIDKVLPQLYIDARSGDHTPDELKRPKPLSPHYVDVYPDAPFSSDALSTSDLRSVLEGDGRFGLFLSLMDAAPQYEALLASGGLYTIFVPTDAALESYADEIGLDLNTLPSVDAQKMIAQHVAPGYITPDYVAFYTYWSDSLNLCTLEHPAETIQGDVMAYLEAIKIDFDDDAALTANGGTVSTDPLFARNIVIYVTEVFRPRPGRG